MIPIEWLRTLIEERDGYHRLLERAGGLPNAAYELARARCMAAEQSTHVPTQREVRAAAREIARRIEGVKVPATGVLAAECEALGLSIL